MMTRKHFNAIAKILNFRCADYGEVIAFVEIFQRDNPRFDRNKFIKASGCQ